jgi:hypothetical protein
MTDLLDGESQSIINYLVPVNGKEIRLRGLALRDVDKANHL